MANERSYGRDVRAYLKREATSGTDPGGNFLNLPFNTINLGKDQGLLDSPRIGAGRTPQEVFQDAPVVGGAIAMPMCMRNIGYLLTGLLGDPSTLEDTGVYTHVFTSEDDDLPSYAIEVAHPSVPAYYLNLGCMVNTMDFDLTRAGPASVNFGLLGMTETKNASTEAGTPTSQTLAWASQFQGAIKEGGTLLANVNNAKLSYSNGLIGIESLNQSGNLEGIDPGPVSCSGSFSSRFYSATYLDAALAKTPKDLEYSFTISASLKLTLTVHEVYFEYKKPPVEGAGGINAELAFRAIRNTAASKLMTATLINNLAGTVYTS